jgi:hypothetical protein
LTVRSQPSASGGGFAAGRFLALRLIAGWYFLVKIETGENPNPTVDTLEKIAKALGVPTAELFK